MRPWVTADEDCRDDMAAIVGALPLEVAVMNSLTANLHFLLAAFYRPTPTRYRILMEGKAFPSDKFASRSQGACPAVGALRACSSTSSVLFYAC